jgi:uncharacterized lipoprotein YddW (UPF0748 family)
VRRRSFLKTAVLGPVAAAVTKGFSLENTNFSNTPHKNWCWITTNTDRSRDDWKRLFATMRQSGISAILPEIYNGRYAYFASTRLPVKTDWLAQLLPLAKANDLEVHAWMWSMPCLLPDILAKHPDWYSVNALGEDAATKPAYVDYYKFLDPGRPEVREFVQATVKELAGIPELTGVHLDYIRHPDAILPKGLWSKYNIIQDKVYPQYDYGYTPYERATFKSKFGIDPLSLKDPNADSRWVKFRLDMVVDLVNQYLAPAAHAKGKLITAAVFPGPTLAKMMVRQDWGRFNLDAFLPMLYNNFYETGPDWIREQTREGADTTHKPIYSGLFVPSMIGSGLDVAIKAARAGGASGVALFSADGMDDAKWSALRTTNAIPVKK